MANPTPLDTWLAAREALEQGATPRPWKVDPYSARYVWDANGVIVLRAEESDVPLLLTLRNEEPAKLAVIAAAAPLIAWLHLGAVGRVEALAEAFYRETGMMAPGKSVPLAMGCSDDDERRRAYSVWIDGLNVFWEARVATAASALSALLGGAQ